MGTGEMTGRSVESWSTAVLFVAGGLWLVDTALFTLDGVIAVSNPDPVAIKLAAILASAVGMLGLYPQLADRTPRFARAGGALLAFARGASTVLFVLVLSREAVASVPSPPAVTASVPFVAMLLGVLLYGSTSLNGGVPSRSVGLLLLAHFGFFFVTVPAYGRVEAGLVGAGAVTLVTIASLFRFETVQAGQTAPRLPPRRSDDTETPRTVS